jgi:predicted DNA-binding transcriptional regulator YafY
MDRTERIHKIDQMLSISGSVSTARFLDELQISLATLKRDLEYMKDRLNAPIIWDRDANGYRFDNAPTAGPSYALPGLWFNDSELYALLTMQQLLEDVQPGLLGPHLRPLQSKLQAILGSLKDSPAEIAKRIRVFAVGRRHMSVKHFEVVATATVRRKRLRIVHFNRAAGAHTERIISPQQMVYYRDNWYLDCWCHLRKAIRTFSIDAIESVELLVDVAKEMSIKTLREMLADGYGIFSGKPTQWAKLKIGATSARWAAQTVWHSGQKSSFDDAGNYLLEIPFSDDRELIKDILGLLPDVEILAPDSLRERFQEILKKSSRKLTT